MLEKTTLHNFLFFSFWEILNDKIGFAFLATFTGHVNTNLTIEFWTQRKNIENSYMLHTNFGAIQASCEKLIQNNYIKF